MNITPRIVVVDDFYPNPMEVREAALKTNVEEHPDRHKGLRGPEMDIAPGFAVAMVELIRHRVGKGYWCFQLCVAGTQRVYHSDGQRWAACVYLTPNAPFESGISFFADKELGARSATDVRDGAEEAIVYGAGGAHLLDRTKWDEVDRVGNVFNRLVVWDARMIHSATEYFGTDGGNGRLFQMFFFDAAPIAGPSQTAASAKPSPRMLGS